DIWVGGSTLVGCRQSAFAEHFDGSAWTDRIARNEQDSDEFNALATDPTTGGLWGVGWQTPGFGVYQMSQRYDGSSWSMEPTPSFDANSNLYGVTAVGKRAWAVGYGSAQGPRPLVERWNGAEWRVEPNP